ncbi:hypothetical protein [Bacillus atrophaeus]|uniref:hypothetical protein n=1 Tax=Bacillus atrophaeus TaxID=1452 RepID=UPI001238580F|nr:hypothetical protein [Bacillus atrophaeus]KAA6453979.1 hypothetical protein DX926_06025 [Bacillus atrophaeus]
MSKKILRFTEDEVASKAEINEVGGRVIHQFSPAAFVAELPDEVDSNSLTASTEQPKKTLDFATKLAVDAWIVNSNQGTEAPSPTEGLP